MKKSYCVRVCLCVHVCVYNGLWQTELSNICLMTSHSLIPAFQIRGDSCVIRTLCLTAEPAEFSIE